jgi:ribosomal protein S18 acetylase RimI-like enzyme
MLVRPTLILAAVLAAVSPQSHHAFTTSHASSSSRRGTALFVADVDAPGAQKSKAPIDRIWTVSKLETDDAIMDVAAYRNNRVGPAGVIERQQAKRDAQDNTGAAIRGGVTGLALGVGYGVVTYTGSVGYGGGDLGEAVKNAVVLGGIMGGLLAGNSLSGRNVYVSTMDDATNRLKVDFVEGLMARQDVGFVARIDNADSAYGGRFRQTNGVVAAIDCQLRNCEESQNVKTFGELPPHIHIRNLAVDQKCRRMGIARELVEAVLEYAAKDSPAELVTLVVDDTNTAAISLYKSLGFDIESIGNPSTAMPKYGQWTNGRSIMSKKL